MEPGERVEFRIDESAEPIALRVVKDEANGWVAVTTELEYEYARMHGCEPEPLVRVENHQLRRPATH